MPNKHKNLLRLDEELRNLERPDNTTRNKKKKILAMEDAMQAKITQIKKRHEALRKGLENLAKDKQVQNTEIVRQIDVNTPQLDSSSTQELINTILPQDDVEEGCSGSNGAKGPDEEAGTDSSQDVTLLLIAKVTSQQKVSRGTSLIVKATMTSLIPALRKTALAMTAEAKTAVKKVIAVRVESM